MRHKDHNNLNDSLDNLEWVEAAMVRHKLEKPKKGASNHRAKRYTLFKDCEFKSWDTLKAAVEGSGYSAYVINKSCKGEYRLSSAKDFKWSRELINK